MSVPGEDLFSEADRQRLRQRGISIEEAHRQIDLLRDPPGYADLDRPCTLGDGLQAVGEDEVEDLLARGRAAARRGRCLKFVPASGAASRMFRDLLHYHETGPPLTAQRLDSERRDGGARAAAVRTFLDNLGDFAFRDDLDRALAARGEATGRLLEEGRYGPILEALLSDEALGYAGLPKALLPFHRYADGSRTPFQEHLVEAAELVRDDAGRCRLHFTVAPEHRRAFEDLLRRVGPAEERRRGVRYEVGFSVQKPSTDTLAVDLDDRPFRDADGRLLLRAAGHGALLENLADLDADLVLIKNVDNVAPDRLKAPTYRWSLLLIGLLVRFQERLFDLAGRLDDDDAGAVDEAAAFCRDVLHRPPPDRDAPRARQRLTGLLHRPLRVCGMVPNEGEPGGGPFWVRDEDGLSRQIVESAQVDPDSPEQQARFASATHFHPVFMVCGLRDHRGRPFPLERYVDRRACLVTRKSAGGRELKALERPGLWNGAMAGWNTLFVEVPGIVFNPVKTVLDLLRDEHRAAGAPASKSG